MKNTIVTIIMVIVSALYFTSAAAYTYFGYVEEPVNTRSMSLGGSGSAYCTGGFSFYNPAAAARESSFVALDFGRQWGELTRGSVETAWNFDRWFFAASLNTRTLEFETADITGVLGPASDQESLASFILGIKRDRYALAVAANGLLQNIMDRNAFSASVSGGVTVKVVPDKLTAGFAVLQAGRYHRGFYASSFSAHRDSMSTSVRLGAAWNDTILGSVPVIVSTDAVYSRSSEEVQYPVGIEVKPLPALALRIGKRFNHPTDLMTLGVGICWENISFDAAVVPTTFEGDVETKWLMGLQYTIPQIRQKKIKKRVVIHGDTTMVFPLADTLKKQSAGRTVDKALPQDSSTQRSVSVSDSGVSVVTDTLHNKPVIQAKTVLPVADSTVAGITNDKLPSDTLKNAASLLVPQAREKSLETPRDSVWATSKDK